MIFINLMPGPKRKRGRLKIHWTVRQNFWHTRCVACGSTYDLCIDHIVPVYHGGSDELSNLQSLCRLCNGAKGKRLIPNERIAWFRLPAYKREYIMGTRKPRRDDRGMP